MRTKFLALVSLLLLSACGNTESLEQLRMAKPVDDPYFSALAEGYKNYSEDKAAIYDWNMSKYFADKGLMAAYGRDIVPEYASNWDVGPDAAAQLGEAREKLNAALTANRSTQPALSAATVVAYDRWVESLASDADDALIDERREAFLSGLNSLEAAHVAQPGVDAPSSELNKPETTATILYFPFDSDHLGSSAKAALAQLVTDIKAAGKVNVAINGHADRAGTEPYNVDLSERRAKFILAALKKAGVPANLMHYFAFGESDPAVPTEDGVQEPKNRRVEIFVE